MFQNLDVFRTAAALADYSGQRQAVIAENVANADTPGYLTRDIASFVESYRATGAAPAMQNTRPGHLTDTRPGGIVGKATITRSEQSPNGNSVSIEEQMVAAIDAQRDHDKALAIYRHAMTVLRSAMGR